MKPPPFDYIAATSVDHAIDVLGGSSDAKVLAGGQSLLPLLNMRLAGPDVVVDVGRLDELATITVDDIGSLVIGAAVTQTAALADPRLVAGWPLLHTAIANIGHPQIRNRGTVCGSLAHNDPAAELPAAALALDAIVRVAGPGGRREIAAEELLQGPFITSLQPDELLLETVFPPQPPGAGWSFREFTQRPGDFATAGVAVRLTTSPEGVEPVGAAPAARAVAFGLASMAKRLPETERVLSDLAADDTTPDDISLDGTALEAVIAVADREIDTVDDVHASAAARRDLIHRLLTEAVTEAWSRSR